MASFRIVCTDQEPEYQPTTHAHIVGVGTGTDPAKADRRWTLKEVLDAIDRGDVFYTQGVTSGAVALVQKFVCAYCTKTHIRSTPDAVPDNNLDNLRRCRWQS